MHIIKRIFLLLICVVTLGSASNSIFLDYSIENLNDQQIQDRQIERLDLGFQFDTEIESINPPLINRNTMEGQNVLYQKGKLSYAQKSAYY